MDKPSLRQNLSFLKSSPNRISQLCITPRIITGHLWRWGRHWVLDKEFYRPWTTLQKAPINNILVQRSLNSSSATTLHSTAHCSFHGQPGQLFVPRVQKFTEHTWANKHLKHEKNLDLRKKKLNKKIANQPNQAMWFLYSEWQFWEVLLWDWMGFFLNSKWVFLEFQWVFPWAFNGFFLNSKLVFPEFQ